MTLNHYTNDIFLSGSDVDLLALSEKVVEQSNWYGWFNDEETTSSMQKHYFPNTKLMQLNFFRNEISNQSSNKLQLGILHKKNQVIIGVISLSNIDFLNQKCEIGGLIGEKNYKNISYWAEANRLLIKHAKNSLNMNRVYGASFIKEVAIFYERLLGFELEGVLKKDVFKNGVFNDVYLFGKLLK